MLELDWVSYPVSPVNVNCLKDAQTHQNKLTKPPGSLGRLEELAQQLAAMQSCAQPEIKHIQISIFVADHGIAEENVSAFPQVVTLEMVKNFSRGGAAISVLAKQLDAHLEVINVGTVNQHEALPGVLVQRVAAGTHNFSVQPAMSALQLSRSLKVGAQAVLRALEKNTQLFIGGDMGIANTTSATAIACALINKEAKILAGPGTGLDKRGVSHKASVIEKSLTLHGDKMQTPLDVLQCVGGFEIAALTGAYIASAQKGLPILVDGFISSVAALAAVKINPKVREWMFFSHTSAEPGHHLVLQALKAEPLLNLGLRLGEASGAAVVVPLMRMACALHNEMATFEQAQVSTQNAH